MVKYPKIVEKERTFAKDEPAKIVSDLRLLFIGDLFLFAAGNSGPFLSGVLSS